MSPLYRPAAQTPRLLARTTTLVDVNNSTTETTLFTATVPAGVMGTNRTLRLQIDGDYLNNSGLTLTTSETLRIYFGGSVIWADAGKAHAASANRKPLSITVRITNAGATNSQVLGGTITLGGSPSTTGIGEYGDDEIDAQTAIGHATASPPAVDTTAAQTLSVSVQHGQAATTISYRLYSATLELV